MEPGIISRGGGFLVFTKIRNKEEDSGVEQGGGCHSISQYVVCAYHMSGTVKVMG